MTMPICLTFTDTALPPSDAAVQADLQALAAQSMGWQPLDHGVYLHHGDAFGQENVIHVVGVPDVAMARLNVLLLV